MIKTLKKNLLSRKKFHENEAILIFGDPRSGSTWLAEIIAKKIKACIVDEPLHLNNDHRLKTMNYGWRQYIPEESLHQESLSFFRSLFQGVDLSSITLHKNGFIQLASCQKLVYKVIRGKLLLPFLLKNFAFTYKPIFLVRHPLAVLHSMKLHDGWTFSYTPFKVPDVLFNEIYVEHQDFLMSLESQEEIMVSLWCISNRNFLVNQMYENRVDTVFYEELLKHPKEILSSVEILKGEDLQLEDFSFESKTVGNSFQKDTNQQVSKWKQAFSSQQLKSFQNILDYFEVTTYSINTASPVK